MSPEPTASEGSAGAADPVAPSRAGRWGRWATRTRLGTLFLVGALLPLLGLAGVSGVVVQARWADRHASQLLEDRADELGRVAAVRAAFANEETWSTILAVASALGVDPAALPGADGAEIGPELVDARRAVDAAVASVDIAGLGPRMEALADLRDVIDGGTATYEGVTTLFVGIGGTVERRWGELEAGIEGVANSRPMSSELRSRLRGVRETVTGFSPGNVRIRTALSLLLGIGGDGAREDLTKLVDASARFDAAFERAVPSFGPRATAAWRAFQEDPAARRTEALMEAAITTGFGGPSPVPMDGASLAAVLADGSDWALLTIDVLTGASADMEATAHAQVRDATRAVVANVAVTALLALVSAAVAVLIGRSVARPAVALEAAARQVQRGEFDLRPVAPGGSREMAASVGAFNDMAATLAAVEDQAVALAEGAGAGREVDPLPGRTGRALQVAMDRLQASMQQAAQQRAALHEMATRDALTGLLNRRAAFEDITRDLARARRDGTRVMALYVDLDGLKALNDTYGHAAGDLAIRRTAEVLMATTRQSDVVARLGGDEFLVAGIVGPGPDGLDEIGALVDRIHDAISRALVAVGPDEREVPLGASIGVATSAPDLLTVDALIRAADVALYEAKRGGRGRVAWA